MFSGKPVSVKMLGSEWWHRMIDVCGVGYITHLDPDHLPLKEYVLNAKVRFFTAPKFVEKLSAFYGKAFNISEYNDVLMMKHTTFSEGRFVEKDVCAMFIGNAATRTFNYFSVCFLVEAADGITLEKLEAQEDVSVRHKGTVDRLRGQARHVPEVPNRGRADEVRRLNLKACRRNF
jgi:hypothetical protein